MTASPPTKTEWILPLNAEMKGDVAQEIALVGGKGANLVRLAQAGFPVPEGFLVTTHAYRSFVGANDLEGAILAALPTKNMDDLAALEAASKQIRALFAAGEMPPALAQALVQAYKRMQVEAVAVRSSATAEDLPEMSFAGQQDTYLNVTGAQDLLEAVVNCWSSLWTARAIGYRARNQVPHAGAALSVIVQHMVESQAAGVLFTANPLSGQRSEAVIDATLGLGEALVSGQVEPDHYVVDMEAQRIVEKTLGAKSVAVRGQPGGGTQRVEEDQHATQALPDEQILELARLGQQVAKLYEFPQDIEWASLDGRLYLLQSRPVTSLFPVPSRLSSEPLQILFSFAAVQGVMDPITPLGRDAIKTIFAAGASLFGVQVTSATQRVIYTAGERLWVNVTAVMRNSVGRRIFRAALSFIEPSVQQAVESLWDDPQLLPERKGIRLRALRQMAGFFLSLAGNLLLNMAAPRTRRERILRNSEQILEDMRARIAAIDGDRYAKLAQRTELLPRLAEERLPHTFILFISAVASGMAAFNLLGRLGASLNGKPGSSQPNKNGASNWGERVLKITRGLPHNPTTEMDLVLWQVAQEIRQDPAGLQTLQSEPATVLAERFQNGQLSAPVQQAVGRFLDKYGGRGLGEIDLGRERWLDDPTHVFEVLGGYLKIERRELAPDAVFARGAEQAEKTASALVTELGKTRFGWFKARLAGFFIKRMRQWMGMRESPKFFAVRMMALIRGELVKSGAEFMQAGELEHADDLVYLRFSELRSLAAGGYSDWQGTVAERRQAYQRERLRKQVPRLLLSDGRAFYKGLQSSAGSADTLHGSPVSPGSVEGVVRVVLDPRQANLLPGEILVCPGTDPSWTPLFLTAAGLVMEVGGMMTHGAVVAREYGIPAVVGVDQATQRLQTGQRILVDGSSGDITLLDGNSKPDEAPPKN
jgi:phosphohistidine swiveling domain-containing protein